MLIGSIWTWELASWTVGWKYRLSEKGRFRALDSQLSIFCQRCVQGPVQGLSSWKRISLDLKARKYKWRVTVTVTVRQYIWSGRVRKGGGQSVQMVSGSWNFDGNVIFLPRQWCTLYVCSFVGFAWRTAFTWLGCLTFRIPSNTCHMHSVQHRYKQNTVSLPAFVM